MTKIKEEVLNQIKNHNKEMRNIQARIGDLEMAKTNLVNQGIAHRNALLEIEKELVQEYGENAVLNTETGEVKNAKDKHHTAGPESTTNG